MPSDKNHWENIYTTKQADEVSWTQYGQTTSFDLIVKQTLSLDDAVIDVGGGDSQLVDQLLQAGYTDVTVLDISQAAIDRAKKRLGPKAEEVNWVCINITDYQPNRTFDIWHDRAALHFLRTREELDKYSKLINENLDHAAILSTFSKKGPIKCSGLEIHQYNQQDLSELIGEDFVLEEHFTEDHITPFNTPQNFQFAVLVRT